MPMYSYYCDKCDQTIDVLKSIKEMNYIVYCETCQGKMSKLITMPIQVGEPKTVGGLADKNRKNFSEADLRRIEERSKVRPFD